METIREFTVSPPKLLPENGSVVIIDDKPNEALPILKALSKKGIATTYYQGLKADMPITPVQSCRLVFLDLQLIESSDEIIISKSVVNVLNAIISEHNGPYLLVIWSKKYHLYGSAVKAEINKQDHLIPACIVGFDKIACLESRNQLAIEPDGFLERLDELLEGSVHDDDLDKMKKAVREALNEETILEYIAKPNAVDLIEEQLRTELEKAGAFHLFVIWENIIKRAAGKMVKDVSCLVSNNDHWEANMGNIFKRMGIARVGTNNVSNDILIRESINTLNTSLVDNIETEIKKEPIPDSISLNPNFLLGDIVGNNSFVFETIDKRDSFFKNTEKILGPTDRKGVNKEIDNSKKILEEDRIAIKGLIEKYKFIPYSLNTKLHIELLPSQELIPGNIYYNEQPDKKSKYLETFFKSIKGKEDDYFLIDLEVSPVCDYAQNKWKRSRTLPGVLFPAEFYDDLKSQSNYHYDVEPVFDISGKSYKFRFDFHLFNALDKQTAKSRNVVYRLKRELLLDIIAQLSSHVNRPGISFIQ